MQILVTGGCGYTGSVLVPKLMGDGHHVTVVDSMWFGNYLEEDSRATIVREDVRNVDAISMDGVDVVIHLANIARTTLKYI